MNTLPNATSKIVAIGPKIPKNTLHVSAEASGDNFKPNNAPPIISSLYY